MVICCQSIIFVACEQLAHIESLAKSLEAFWKHYDQLEDKTCFFQFIHVKWFPGFNSILALLVMYGHANINATQPNGTTPLMLACREVSYSKVNLKWNVYDQRALRCPF